MLFVIIAWVLFRATNIASAYAYINVMFVSNGASADTFWLYWANYRFYLILGMIISFLPPLLKDNVSKSDRGILNENKNCSIIVGVVQTNHTLHQSQFLVEILKNFVFIWLFLLSVAFIVKSNYNPFIYFNF